MISTPQNGLMAQFELWFRMEMPGLYRYLCYQTHDTHIAEEITSRTCEKALKKIDQYDPLRGEMRVWLFGIARNELRSYFRSIKQEPDQVSLDSLPDFNFRTNTPEQEFQRKEAFVQIMNELIKLPKRDQELVALRYGAGLPVQQMAVIMGLEENHIGVLLHRAIEKIKNSLKEVTYGK